jgi:hypothetical protein
MVTLRKKKERDKHHFVRASEGLTEVVDTTHKNKLDSQKRRI